MSRVRSVWWRKSLTNQRLNAWRARDSRTRRLGFEMLEERALLTVAQDLADLMAPYQQALNTALGAATSLPLVGNQLAGLSEFNSILQNTESSIAPQTQNITGNGHYQITVALPSLAKTFSFDLGLDAFLQATATGNVSATINPTLHVGFDYNNGAVSLDLGQTRFDIGFGLSLPGFQGTFSFNGLLHTQAVDAGTNFNGVLGFGFASGGALNAQFSGEANIRLGLTMSFVDPALDAPFNPTFRTSLDVNWGFGANNQLAAPSIQLVDLGLEADSFLQGFLGDVVTTVQKFTKPIQPFIDIFQTPVPILSAFDSSETIGTLLLKGAGTSQAQQDSFKLMVQIINGVNSIDLSDSTGGAVIPFGTITVTGDPQQSGSFGFDTSSVTNAIDDIFDIPALQTVEDTLREVGQYAGATSTAGFQFPLLENPGSVIAGILLGQPDTTLFSFSTGRQHFELAPSIGVGIPGILGIFLNAGIVFDANLTMGYDTAGLLKFAQDPNNPAHLLHGFYFDNSIDTSIPPKPNTPPIRKTGLYLEGLMELQADVLLAHASGGLYANISVELVNTDATDHVHLDTMIGNLASGGKVFDLSGKLYASADLSLELSLPIGPDITLFSFNLAYEELLNFDPPPPPDFGVPITVIDVIDQHTLSLDAGKMGVGSRVVTVQPFHNLPLNIGGNTIESDGIRVDYPNEIVFYVERKNDLTTNYYNFIGLNGATPDGVTINVIDPFRVFYDEGASNPAPAQTKPGVLLAGGRNVTYKYTEAPDGSQANVLLAGGYGSNTLGGGTMTFGNFIPADRIAQAKSHFADASGYDGAGLGLVNSVIDAAIAPADPAGIIGAKMTGSRGGLMMGGPGSNSFIAMGAGVYEMIGGAWMNSFNISPSFSGGPATYQIDGGPFGQSSLVVRVPFDETVLFENAAVPDKYDPEFKALAVGGLHGPSAVAHGIQAVKVIASPGSTVEFGDTSELNVQFSIEGAARLKFSGTAEPDVFVTTTDGPFFAKKNHFTVGNLYTLNEIDGSTTLHYVNPIFPDEFVSLQVPDVQRWPDPVYAVTRTFGTNGRTQSIPFSVSDPDESSIILDGKGKSDTYRIAQGVGGFLDVTVEDSDTTTQNTLTVNLEDPDLAYHRAELTDDSLALEYFTLPRSAGSRVLSGSTGSVYRSLSYWTNSVYYSPTIFFGGNVDITLRAAARFEQFVIDRPTAPQKATLRFGVPTFSGQPGRLQAFTFGEFLARGIYVYAPDGPNPAIIYFIEPGAEVTETVIDVQANAGNLSFDVSSPYGHSGVVTAYGAADLTLNIYANSGTLSFNDSSDRILGVGDTFNILGNSGTITLGSNFAAFSRVYNVLANDGTINVRGRSATLVGEQVKVEQVNIGQNGSLANVQGAINFFNDSFDYYIALDDRNNPAAGRQWTIESNRILVGGLSVNFTGVNSPNLYVPNNSNKLEIYLNAGSAVTVNSEPAFFRTDLFGFGSDNTLVGLPLASGTTWRLDGADSGLISLSPNIRNQFQPNELRWTNIQNLVGSDGDDTFQFTGGSVSGDLDGGGGHNTLFYDPPPTPFVVDLANGIAPLVGGTVGNIQTVIPDTPPPPPGDFNGDGTVDAADYTVWRDRGGSQAEYNTWKANFGNSLPPAGAPPLPGDYNNNGIVDDGDYDVWKANFGESVTPGTSGDGNGNGMVDAADYVVWRDNLGPSAPSAGALASAIEASPLDQSGQNPPAATLAKPAGSTQSANLAVPFEESAIVAGQPAIDDFSDLGLLARYAKLKQPSTKPLVFHRWRAELVDRVYQELDHDREVWHRNGDRDIALQFEVFDATDDANQVLDSVFALITELWEDSACALAESLIQRDGQSCPST